MKWVMGIIILNVFAFAETDSVAEPSLTEQKQEAVKEIKGEQKELTLSVGVSSTLEFGFNLGPISITDPSLVEYRRIQTGNQTNKLLIIPKNAGLTDLSINDDNGKPRITYTLHVTREPVGEVISQLKKLLGDIEGLKIEPVGGTIVLDGEILLPKDMSRIFRVVDALKDRDAKQKIPIRNIATISKVTMNVLAERITSEINSEVKARVVNNMVFLEGIASNEAEADRALDIAKSYLPEAFVEKSKGEGGEVKALPQGGSVGGIPTIVDFIQIRNPKDPPPAEVIKITMNYVELNNDYERSFNFQWRPLLQDSSTAQYSTSLGQLSANVVATVSSLLPKLNQAKNHGHARILKQEQLIIKDRSENFGAIESSVDFYVRNVDEKGNVSLQPITVQNATKVKAAKIGDSDSIDLGIQITLNSLLGITEGRPIIAKNNLQTQVTVRNGDSAALGGYSIDQALSSYNREPGAVVPGVQDTSGGSTALFNLQRSKRFNRNKQQYVIFVTPEVLKTASSGNEDITRKFRLNAGE